MEPAHQNRQKLRFTRFGQYHHCCVTDSSQEDGCKQFVSLKQGSGTVQDYNMKCDNLMRYAPDIVADDFRLRRQYLEGPRFTQIIDLPGTVRLVDLMAHALRVESYERVSKALFSM